VARRSLTSELSSAGVSGSVVGDAALVISELVGNAVRHARPLPGGALRAAWTLHGQWIQISVTDGGSTDVPMAVRADEAATGGRGLSIVEALSQSWGTRRSGQGLEVWATLPCGTRVDQRSGCGELAAAP
jgi:anti-sigma regulatory factor (Ser/Thr protein kinase)